MKVSSVLYIDDDADDQEFFEIALRSIHKHMPLSFAKNGLDALARLKAMEHRPDLIFLDLNMPVMDGKQFLERIKKERSLAQIPIAIYTTSSSPADQEQALALGADYFVTKPSRIHDIVKMLSQLLTLPETQRKR